MPIHSALIARYFKTYADFANYLEDVNRAYTKNELVALLEALYRGFGSVEQDEIHLRYEIALPDALNRRFFVNPLVAESEANGRNMLKLAHQAAERSSEVIVTLKQGEFSRFLEGRRQQWFSDGSILLNGSEIRVNKTLLSMSSPYFRSLFSGSYQEEDEVRLCLGKEYTIVADILLNYLMMGAVVVPVDFSTQAWMELAELAEYFCQDSLKSICESQLCGKVHQENSGELEAFGQRMALENLSLHCASFELKHSLKTNELKKKVAASREGKSHFIRLYNTVKFDLFHNEGDHKEPNFKKNRSENEAAMEEKENNREYNNA